MKRDGERIVHLSETVDDDYATARSKIVTIRGAEISVGGRVSPRRVRVAAGPDLRQG